jgi:hypothetical protein
MTMRRAHTYLGCSIIEVWIKLMYDWAEFVNGTHTNSVGIVNDDNDGITNDSDPGIRIQRVGRIFLGSCISTLGHNIYTSIRSFGGGIC